jgi:hypothetical protein
VPVADRELRTFASLLVAGRRPIALGLGALALLAGASEPAFAHVK